MTYNDALIEILKKISIPEAQKWILIEELKKVVEELDDNSE